MRLIGITGGVGAGKSEILKYIGKHYLCKIFYADQVANFLKQPGEACYLQICQLFGKDILLESGEINNLKMAKIMFENQELIDKVNNIIHPEVKKYIQNEIKKAEAEGNVELFLIEAALLIEAGYKEMLDEIWYIYANKDVRYERLQKNRGYSQEKIQQIMKAQLKEEVFVEKSDFIIDNSNSIEESHKQIKLKLEGVTWLE